MHAFIFPGQGSQSVGMLQSLSIRFPIVRQVFERVSDCLGEAVWTLTQEGPEAILNQTAYTQVAMLTADVAVYTVLRQQGFPQAQCMAGHSLGEYAALVAAEAISLEDAARLVRMRGHLMQQTVPASVGAMAAIVGLSDEQVESICNTVSNDTAQVTPANYNAIGQVVIAGHTSAVHAAIELATSMQARLAKIIPVSVPCHCPLLKEAAAQFEATLAEAPFKVPVVPVISNVDLSIYQEVSDLRRLLKAQLYQPVRWVDTILKMKHMGLTHLIECGPGAVLSGLVKRIDKSLQTMSVYDDVRLDQALSLMAEWS